MSAGEWWARGQWNAECDRCGDRFKSSKLLLEYDGLRVCERCWEPRHPQELLRPPRPEQAIPWSRPGDNGGGGGCLVPAQGGPRSIDSKLNDRISQD